MNKTNLILLICFMLLAYGQEVPNKYYLGTTFHGKDYGLILGHMPIGLEAGLECNITSSPSNTREVHKYNYNLVDSILYEESGYISDRIYDYSTNYSYSLFMNKRILNKQSGNTNYSLYMGIKYSNKNSSYKYSTSYSYDNNYNNNERERESISIDDLFGGALGIKMDYRILKHIAFEFDYNIEIKYKVNQKTMKDWKYNEEGALVYYDQTLEKSSNIYTSLGSPRIIVKYFF